MNHPRGQRQHINCYIEKIKSTEFSSFFLAPADRNGFFPAPNRTRAAQAKWFPLFPRIFLNIWLPLCSSLSFSTSLFLYLALFCIPFSLIIPSFYAFHYFFFFIFSFCLIFSNLWFFFCLSFPYSLTLWLSFTFHLSFRHFFSVCFIWLSSKYVVVHFLSRT